MSEISKGMLALRKSNDRAERIAIDGSTFYFKKLTISMEADLDRIIKENQDDTLKPPERPADDSPDTVIKAWAEQMVEFKQKSDRAFRRLTAEIMKYILLDETDKPLFAPEDEVYENLNNVFAASFFKAYNQFRNGAEATPAAAERRFQG